MEEDVSNSIGIMVVIGNSSTSLSVSIVGDLTKVAAKILLGADTSVNLDGI